MGYLARMQTLLFAHTDRRIIFLKLKYLIKAKEKRFSHNHYVTKNCLSQVLEPEVIQP